MSQTVFVGISGGVDSSVAAGLLKRDGYKVVGVFMKNWSRDVGGVHCPWREDLASARAAAAQLGIELKVYDFEQEYFDAVAKYMIDTYKKGLTPNPDIMCNAEIKFKVFAERCFSEGADMVATGHYAKLTHNPLRLLRAKDSGKDQTYFLYRAPLENLARTLFPLGELAKPAVRKLAVEMGLPNADRPDSQGLCFVGNVPMKSFLSEFIEPKEGDIVGQDGNVVGQHDGSFFYTIGQRHGLGVGGGKPYFVYKIDTKLNRVYVTTNPDSLDLNTELFTIGDCYWHQAPEDGKQYQIQVRYRSEAKPGQLTVGSNGSYRVKLSEPERAVTPGQSAVVYSGDAVVGGGIIT